MFDICSSGMKKALVLCADPDQRQEIPGVVAGSSRRQKNWGPLLQAASHIRPSAIRSAGTVERLFLCHVPYFSGRSENVKSGLGRASQH
jgi:hypothetical protein